MLFPIESLSLAQDGIFLALEKGGSVFYTDIYSTRAFLWQLNLNFYCTPYKAGCLAKCANIVAYKKNIRNR
jgi:hypothetical protein